MKKTHPIGKTLIIGINLGDFGSTGTIMHNTLEYATKNGNYDALAIVPTITRKQISNVKYISFKKRFSALCKLKYKILFKLKCLVFEDGNYYKENTKNIIKIIKKYSKNYSKVFLHLHNLHHCNIDVNYFYKWLGKSKLFDNIFYTLHDCWTFTGGCYYYSYTRCNGWKNKCMQCPQHLKNTEKTLLKRTALLQKIKNLTLIPCSEWLYNEIKKSKLKKIRAIVNNGETSLQPYVGNSDLKKKLKIENKKVLLSVSAYWNDWKGIGYYYDLADKLPEDYVLLLVGGSIQKQHDKIIHINKISNSNSLAEYYSIADVFVSLTQSDNLPLVLMEAQICGVPVVGFGHGGTPEEITSKTGIMVGEDNDVTKILNAVKYVIETKPFRKEDIVASGNRFKEFECAKRQFDIYERVSKDESID